MRSISLLASVAPRTRLWRRLVGWLWSDLGFVRDAMVWLWTRTDLGKSLGAGLVGFPNLARTTSRSHGSLTQKIATV
jgi:hypothetical protein